MEIFGTSFNKSLSPSLLLLHFPRLSTTTFNLSVSRAHARSKFASLFPFYFPLSSKKNRTRIAVAVRERKIGNIRVKERGDLDRRVLTGFRRRDLESLFLFSLLFSLKKRWTNVFNGTFKICTWNLIISRDISFRGVCTSFRPNFLANDKTRSVGEGGRRKINRNGAKRGC